MPLYMDRHKHIEGLTAEAVAQAHQKDLEAQDKHGAKPSSTGSTRIIARSSACSTHRTPRQQRPSTARHTGWWPMR